MKILRTVAEVRQALERPRIFGTVGLVPTMGALHEGHVMLIKTARRECDTLVASIFVNPTQFGDPADLEAYPRDEARDAQIAGEAGVDYLFVPTVQEIYPPGSATWVDVQRAAQGLEGEFRPGHFRGVATICLKLFLIVGPRVAFFGQKDAQQVAVVTEMVQDLNVDVVIRVVPTVRDRDGLALSSRNARLSAEQRARALAIPRALDAGLTAARAGGDPAAAARLALADLDVDYVAVAELSGHPTLAIAARVGKTRLIDNVRLDDPSITVRPSQETRHGS
jgi:pantoate--beta-alanine ligase